MMVLRNITSVASSHSLMVSTVYLHIQNRADLVPSMFDR